MRGPLLPIVGCVVATIQLHAQPAARAAAPKFLARGDEATLVHILPPPKTWSTEPPGRLGLAVSTPRVFTPSFGTGKLIDHGGAEVVDAAFFAVYWNRAVASSPQTSLGFPTIRAQIHAFVNAFSDDHHYDRSATDDYTIIQQYSERDHISAPLLYLGSLVDTRRTLATVSDAALRRHLGRLFSTGRLYAARNVIYGIFLPPGTTSTLPDGEASCLDFCGYHSAFLVGGMWIKYVVLPFPDCPACSLTGLRVADLMTIVLGHEIRETVTDPGDEGQGTWFDAAGLEADDKCAWHHLYRMANGGFWMQPEFSNGGRGGSTGVLYPGPGCVVPR